VEGIEFRSVTVTAQKAGVGPSSDANQALIYRGPWKAVEDEGGNRFVRGERTAVSATAFQNLRGAPYESEFVAIRPRVSVPEEEQSDLEGARLRDPRETKGVGYRATRKPGQKGCC